MNFGTPIQNWKDIILCISIKRQWLKFLYIPPRKLRYTEQPQPLCGAGGVCVLGRKLGGEAADGCLESRALPPTSKLHHRTRKTQHHHSCSLTLSAASGEPSDAPHYSAHRNSCCQHLLVLKEGKGDEGRPLLLGPTASPPSFLLREAPPTYLGADKQAGRQLAKLSSLRPISCWAGPGNWQSRDRLFLPDNRWVMPLSHTRYHWH